MKKVPVLLLMFLCIVSLFGDQVKPSTIDLMVDFFQQLNEEHKERLSFPDGEEYLSVTREELEKYPMAFLELVYYYRRYTYLSGKIPIIKDLRESVLLSLIDYPITRYTSDNFVEDRSKIGLMKEEDVEGYKNKPSNQSPNASTAFPEEYKNFKFYGALYASGTETSEAIISNIISSYLYDLFRNEDIDLSGKSVEIQARVANRNWSSMEILNSGDSIALLSVTNLDKESRKELLRMAKSEDSMKDSMKEARYQQAREKREKINRNERLGVPYFCYDYLRDGYTYKPETTTRQNTITVRVSKEDARKDYLEMKQAYPNTPFFNMMTVLRDNLERTYRDNLESK